MPAMRGDIDQATGRSYTFMQPAASVQPGKSWSALDVPCPDCGAEPGGYCPGARICPGRMVRLREMIEMGELEGDVIPAQRRDCPDCRKRRNQTDTKWLACDDPAHRCQSMDRGSRCSGAVVTGKTRCPKHLAC